MILVSLLMPDEGSLRNSAEDRSAMQMELTSSPLPW